MVHWRRQTRSQEVGCFMAHALRDLTTNRPRNVSSVGAGGLLPVNRYSMQAPMAEEETACLVANIENSARARTNPGRRDHLDPIKVQRRNGLRVGILCFLLTHPYRSS